MTSTPPDWHRIALALNNVATTFQQLAVECDAAARAARTPTPAAVRTTEQRMADHGLVLPVCDRFTPPPGGGYVCQRCRREYLEHTYQASLTEPACGCSLYTRCEEHSTEKRCKCNGPAYRSSACLITYHAQQGRSMPDRDPALAD